MSIEIPSGHVIYGTRVSLRTAIDHIRNAPPEHKLTTDAYISWLMCDDEGVYAKAQGKETHATQAMQ
jgi:hypothetical protein